MFNKLKQIKDIRNQAKEMQKMLADVVVVGQSSGSKVMVTLNGNQEVLGVKIEGENDNTTLESAIKEAFNDATKKLQKEMATKMKDMGGLDTLKDMLGG